jgi:hypothetical protein
MTFHALEIGIAGIIRERFQLRQQIEQESGTNP